MNFPTIVSAFYDIRKRDNININCSRKKNTYLELANEFILKLPYPLLIFTDEEDIMQYILQKRNEYDLIQITHVVMLPFENTYFYSYLDKITELRTKFTILNGNPNHEIPLYIILNNNKFDFIEKSIELNPFQSTHFIWMDFGINHVAKNTEKIHEWILHVPDKIKQLCINPYLENEDRKILFRYIYHHMAGGLFSGNIQNLLIYSNKFKQMIDKIYQEEWYQIDEAIMTMVQRDNPEIFDLYYGDYQGIISNYLEPLHNLDLIQRMLYKSYEMGRRDISKHICEYIKPYFKKDENQNNDFFKDFIFNYIVYSFYLSNQILSTELITFINKNIIKRNEKIIQLLQSMNSFIQHFQNKHLIIKY
jgi:hypothetical protein